MEEITLFTPGTTEIKVSKETASVYLQSKVWLDSFEAKKWFNVLYYITTNISGAICILHNSLDVPILLFGNCPDEFLNTYKEIQGAIRQGKIKEVFSPFSEDNILIDDLFKWGKQNGYTDNIKIAEERLKAIKGPIFKDSRKITDENIGAISKPLMTMPYLIASDVFQLPLTCSSDIAIDIIKKAVEVQDLRAFKADENIANWLFFRPEIIYFLIKAGIISNQYLAKFISLQEQEYCVQHYAAENHPDMISVNEAIEKSPRKLANIDNIFSYTDQKKLNFCIKPQFSDIKYIKRDRPNKYGPSVKRYKKYWQIHLNKQQSRLSGEYFEYNNSITHNRGDHLVIQLPSSQEENQLGLTPCWNMPINTTITRIDDLYLEQSQVNEFYKELIKKNESIQSISMIPEAETNAIQISENNAFLRTTNISIKDQLMLKDYLKQEYENVCRVKVKRLSNAEFWNHLKNNCINKENSPIKAVSSWPTGKIIWTRLSDNTEQTVIKKTFQNMMILIRKISLYPE